MMTIRFNGETYNFWETVSVEASIKNAERTFTVQVSPDSLDGDPTPAVVLPGSPVQIFTNGDLLLDGFVNEFSPSFDAGSHAISISGRSGAQDAADSSAVHPTGRFENRTAVEIANELSGRLGIRYSSMDQLPKIPVFQFNQGETVHQIARRLANIYGYSLMGDGEFGINFVKAGSDLLGEIREGVAPLLSASSTLTDTSLFSNYEFKGQLSSYEDKYEDEAAHNVSEVRDSKSTRNRSHIAIVDKSTDRATAMTRADWKARRIGGENSKVSATISGHHLNGQPVVPNKRVFVNSLWLLIANEMLIDTVTWAAGYNEKTQCSFTLVPPESYDGEATKSSGARATRADGRSAQPLSSYSGSAPVPVAKPLINPPQVA